MIQKQKFFTWSASALQTEKEKKLHSVAQIAFYFTIVLFHFVPAFFATIVLHSHSFPLLAFQGCHMHVFSLAIRWTVSMHFVVNGYYLQGILLVDLK